MGYQLSSCRRISRRFKKGTSWSAEPLYKGLMGLQMISSYLALLKYSANAVGDRCVAENGDWTQSADAGVSLEIVSCCCLKADKRSDRTVGLIVTEEGFADGVCPCIVLLISWRRVVMFCLIGDDGGEVDIIVEEDEP
jgi:hypothetical protein